MTIDLNIENPENIKFGLIDLKKLNIRAIDEAKIFFNYKCPYCKNDLHAGTIRENAEIDHFIPVKKGGQDFPWNLLPICFECNRKKKHKMPYEFLQKDRYIECKDYLNKVLYKCTNQHVDKLQIASQFSYFVKQHVENKINDKELIKNLYEICNLDIKKLEENAQEQTQITNDDTIIYEHINHFWNAISSNTRPKGYNKVKYLDIDPSRKRIYVNLAVSYPIYVDYCNQIDILPESISLLRSLLTKDYKPFIKSTQKSRKLSWTRAGLGSCYCFKYEQSLMNRNIIIIGNNEITL